MKKKISQLLALFIFLFSMASFAANTWQILPNESSISFTATQNDAPVSGKFKNFTGEIVFNPNQLSSSHVKIVIDVASVMSSYNEVTDTLKTEEWFNTKAFPQAVYKSDKFVKTGPKNYQSNGILTIRNKSVPITLNFTVEEYSFTKLYLQGTALLKRIDFGVGQGQWADTKSIKDSVKVDFILVAKK